MTNEVDAQAREMQVLAYAEMLGPTPWNNDHGGDVWCWVKAHGGTILVNQDPGGPAYGCIAPSRKDEGWCRVGIGEVIEVDADGMFSVRKRESA